MKLKRPFPQGAVIGGIVAAGLFVGLVGWFVVIRPQSHKAASLAKQTVAVQAQITSNLAAIAAQRNTTATAAPKIRVADVYKLAKAMPSAVDMPDILLELDQVAKDAGVDLQNISPSTPAADGTINLSMSVAGDFFTVTDLLYRLRNLVSVRNGALEATGRLFSVDNLNLSPADGTKLDATISLHTYQYLTAPVAAAPVAAPPVTSTDTTSTSTDTTATTTTPSTPASGPSAAGAP
jgi:Tfp pilus assembly protein PilO